MRIKIEISRSQWSEPFFKSVYNLGYEITDSSHADIIVKQADFITESDLSGNGSLIALERTDGANISHRHILMHPNVKHYIKQYNYSNFLFHNLPCVDERLFTVSLTRDENLFKANPVSIDEAHYKKIILGWNILHYSRMAIAIPENESTPLNKDRDIDVFFVGTTSYCNSNFLRRSADLIREHREKCITAINSLKGKSVLAFQGRPYTQRGYLNMLHRSKVVVSPWGWGEACYRDYEAILAGCVLVKPLSDFVISSCNIFQDSYCRWIDPNFLDFQDSIESALDYYNESLNGRLLKRNKLVDSYKSVDNILRRIL